MFTANSIFIIWLLLLQIKWIFTFSKQNEKKPLFLIDFELASVLCQHSDDPKDLHLHDISILCDGRQDCLPSLSNQDDETFPHCRHLQCGSKNCNGKGACIFDGFTTRCFCNEGSSGLNCEYFGKDFKNEENLDEFGLEFGKVAKSSILNKNQNEKKNWLKMKGILEEAKKFKKEEDEEDKQFGLLIGKGKMVMIGQETSTINSETTTEANRLTNNEATSASDSKLNIEASTEATSVSNAEATSASYSKLNNEANSISNIEATSILNTEANNLTSVEATSTSNIETKSKTNKEANTEVTKSSNFETSASTSTLNNEATSISNLETKSVANTEANKLTSFKTTSASYSKLNNEATSISNLETNSVANTETLLVSNFETKSETNNEANTETNKISNFEATSIKNSETISILNLKSSSASSSELNYEAITRANYEAFSTANSLLNYVSTSIKSATNFESKSTNSNNEASSLANTQTTLTYDKTASATNNEVNTKLKNEATSVTNSEATEEILSDTTLSAKNEETFKIRSASTKKFSIKDETEANLLANSLTSETPNYASNTEPSASKTNPEANFTSKFEAKSTEAITRGNGVSKNITDNIEANYATKTKTPVAETKEANNQAIYFTTTKVSATSISSFEASSISGNRAFSTIEARTVADNEAKTIANNEATSIKPEAKNSETTLKEDTLVFNTATPMSSIEATSLSSTIENTRSTPTSESVTSEAISIETGRLSFTETNTEAFSTSKTEARSTLSIATIFQSSETTAATNTEANSSIKYEATSLSNDYLNTETSILPTNSTPNTQLSTVNTKRNFEVNSATNIIANTEAIQTKNSEANSATISPSNIETSSIPTSEANVKSTSEAAATASSFSKANSSLSTLTTAKSIARKVSEANAKNEANSLKNTEAIFAKTPVAEDKEDFTPNPESKTASPTIEANILTNTEASSIPNIKTETYVATSLLNTEATSSVIFEATSLTKYSALNVAAKSEATTIEASSVTNFLLTLSNATTQKNIEATSLSKPYLTSISNEEAKSLRNTGEASPSNEASSKSTTIPSLIYEKNKKENIEAKSTSNNKINSLESATSKFKENTEASIAENANATTSITASSFTPDIKYLINSTLEATPIASVKPEIETTSLYIEATSEAKFLPTSEANIETASSTNSLANFNIHFASKNSEANFSSTKSISEAESFSAVYPTDNASNWEATIKEDISTQKSLVSRFTKLQNCLQNWTTHGRVSPFSSITEASASILNKNTASSPINTVPVQDSALPSKIQDSTLPSKIQDSTLPSKIQDSTLHSKITLSLQDFTLSSKSIVSLQNNTISPISIYSNAVSHFGFNCSKKLNYYCGQQAFCSDKSICQCLPGFSGFPPLFPCNEIQLNASNSPKTFECSNNETGSVNKCRCENGYFLNKNGSCEDIDECKTGVAVCGKEAFCRNLEGAYRCECQGLKEDGLECAALSPKSIKDYIQVKCFRGEKLENAAIQVVFTSNVWKQFKGRVIVNGSQAENPKCFKDFSSNNSNNNSFNFLIPANDCKLIQKGIKITTLSTRLLIQPTIEKNYFLNSPIYFLQIQCHFTLGEDLEGLINLNKLKNSKNSTKITIKTGTTKTPFLTSKTPKMTNKKVLEDIFDNKMIKKTTKEPLKTKMKETREEIKIKEKTSLKAKEEVKMTREPLKITRGAEILKSKMTTIGSSTMSNLLKNEEEQPICLLDVTDKNGVHVLKIKAGETLTLTLSLVSPKWQQKINNSIIFPKRCYAINLNNGGRYCLTDNGGCAFEKGLFPEWKRKTHFEAEANFSAFRWTQTNTVRFECDCSICSEEKGPKIDCEKRRNLRFKKYFNYNWSNSLNENEVVENLANLIWLDRPTSLPVAMEVDEIENKKKRRKRSILKYSKLFKNIF